MSKLIKNIVLPVLNVPPLGIFLNKLSLSVAKDSIPTIWDNACVEVFNVCNLRCKMCAYDQMNRPKHQMSMDLFTKVVNNLIEEPVAQTPPYRCDIGW